jgi:GntR family transcriptional regulator
MTRALHVNPQDAIPIWKQIEDGLRHLVASGALSPGGAVPSVRDLAKDLRINPATVAKAYQHLTDSGILAVKRGEGTFVAEAPPALAKGERSKTLHDSAVRYASVAVTMSVGVEDSIVELRSAFSELRKGDSK